MTITTSSIDWNLEDDLCNADITRNLYADIKHGLDEMDDGTYFRTHEPGPDEIAVLSRGWVD